MVVNDSFQTILVIGRARFADATDHERVDDGEVNAGISRRQIRRLVRHERPDGVVLHRDHFYDTIDEAITAIDAAGRGAAEV